MAERDRYLATILFTDIVGSTQRAAELGDRRWQDLLREHDVLVRREVERHGGREVNTAGDGFVVTFAEPESAVRCAKAVGDAVRELGVRIRCGLHTGEVQRAGDDIGGIAVHTAARVAARAGPGEVLVSSTVRDLVAGSGLAFADRGAHELKGVPGKWRLFVLRSESQEPASVGIGPGWLRGRRARVLAAIGAAALVGTVALYAWRARSPGPPDTPPAQSATGDLLPSVAVLPFANGSPDPEDEYFSDGLTEELISALSGIEGLRVLGRTSSFAFKDSAQDVRQIGQALGVGHVIEGSVRRSGERLRIDARLVNAADGYRMWSETYDRELADALEIQADIARSIAAALRIELVDRFPSGAPTPGRTTDPVAYDHYLKGLYFSHGPTEADARASIEYFQRAIDTDPGFALAYAGLALAYDSVVQRFGGGPRDSLMAQAKAAADKAVELDDSLAESHLALATVKTWYEWDWAGAEREFRRAIELGPNYAAARVPYGFLLAALHRPDEAIASLRQGLSLDPLSNLYSADLGNLLHLERRDEEAIAQYRRTLEMEPSNLRAWLGLGRAYLALGLHREAFDAFERAERLPGQTTRKLKVIGYAYAVTGRRGQAAEMLRQVDSLGRHEYIGPADWAALELALGHRERALERIERAMRDRDLNPVYLQLSPELDPLRSDPRFRRVVARMGLPD